MNKKIIAFTMATILITLGVATGTSVKINEKPSEGLSFADMTINLGSATIFGDGIEENTIVEAVTEKELTIEITSDSVTADLEMTYSMQCTGEVDQAGIYLFVQVNGVNIENISVNTTDSVSGKITVSGVTLSNGNLLTYEIGALYGNADPFFTKGDLDLGAAVVIKSRNANYRLFDMPIFQFFTKLSIFARLFRF